MKRAKIVLAGAAVVLIGTGTGVGFAATSSGSGSGFLPVPAGMTQQERVSLPIYKMCLAVINPTAAQVNALPADQKTELLAVEDWCSAFAIRTNPTPTHSG